MKHIFLILSVFIFQLSSYGQEIEISDPDSEEKKKDFELEFVDDKYVLHLSGIIDKYDYYIEFIDKPELINFLEKALKLFEIDIPENSRKEAKIEWTNEHLKFCSLKGADTIRSVSMSRDGLFETYGEKEVSITTMLMYKIYKDNIHSKHFASHRFTKNEIIGLYNSVSDNKLEMEQIKEPKNSVSSGYYGIGGDGSGGNYRLGNRKAKAMPAPDYPCNQEGKVVVTITVNQSGNVISAVAGAKGTTNSARCLLNEAKKAAMSSKFNADSKAPTKQVGEIIYNFSLSD